MTRGISPVSKRKAPPISYVKCYFPTWRCARELWVLKPGSVPAIGSYKCSTLRALKEHLSCEWNSCLMSLFSVSRSIEVKRSIAAMATQMDLIPELVTSMDIEQSTSRPPLVSSDRQPELRRLATFRPWKQDMPLNFSKSLLAKLGFSYTGEQDKVKCDGCQMEIALWRSKVNLQEEHQRCSPQCPFVMINSHFFVQTGTTSSHLIEKMKIEPCFVGLEQSRVPVTTISSPEETEETADEEDPNTSNELRIFLRTVSEKALDQLRERTLSNWPLITPNAHDMARAGWWYTNIQDRVICIHCHAMCHKWTDSDLPFDLHEQISPSCPFVQATKKQSVNSSKSQLKITTKPKTQVMPEPINTPYAPASHRYQTFQKWPERQADSLPSIESFVDAGFFYTGKLLDYSRTNELFRLALGLGELTIVRCFFCNGALRNWQSRDDPKIEHARWFPQCAYIRQLIGEDLYEAIQRKNRELKGRL